jgi:hypothetical protein
VVDLAESIASWEVNLQRRYHAGHRIVSTTIAISCQNVVRENKFLNAGSAAARLMGCIFGFEAAAAGS